MVNMMTDEERSKARAFVAKVEADLGYTLTDHIVDLFFDNAEELGLTDEECVAAGNLIRADKGYHRCHSSA